MRVSFATLLLIGPCLSAHCSYGQGGQASKTGAAAATHTSHGTSSTSLGPAPNQRLVKPEYVLQGPSYYAATLPVLHDKDGIISITVTVNPKTHSVQKLDAILAPLNRDVTYRQIGNGIGRYDASTGRYYFNTAYQKTQQLPAGFTDHKPLRQITGWIDPSTSQAAVGEEATP
jgi:hypothetical protein